MTLQPYIYHIAEAHNWPLIQQHGLLSAEALLKRAGALDVVYNDGLCLQRTSAITLSDGALIRDQGPMPPSALQRCLHDMTPSQWYALLNSKVFFWLDVARLNRLRLALGATQQIVLTVATEPLLAQYADAISLTPINSGNARRKPALRGYHSFVPYKTWLQSGWNTETEALGTRPRPRSHQPVELTASHSIPNISDFIVAVDALSPGDLFTPRV